jgi:4-amino-4-deoxy-L-arabinose transferase-like glycosyltransferase
MPEPSPNLPRAPSSARWPRSDLVLLGCLGSATLLLHFAVNGRYGYWVDELYFIACGEHLAWGYVDQPPLIAAVAKLSRWLLGDSLFAIRFFPALAGAALVLVTGLLTRALGGGRFAQVLAAVAVIVAPVYLGFQNLLTMNAFEPLLWTLCAYTVVVVVRERKPRLWLLVGVIAGIGLLNKYSIGFFGVSLAVGLLLTPERRLLMSGWIWLAGLLAVLIVLPHLLWEYRLGWPSVELLRNAKIYQHQPVSPAEFVWGQIQLVHPFALPLWLAGLAYLFTREGKPVRFLGWAYVVLFGVSLLTQAKSYYLAPAYPMLLGAGAVATERFIRRREWRWLKPASIGFLLVGGALSAPYVLPVLPIELVPQYLGLIHLKAVRPERRQEGEVPQLFADMFGWEGMVAAVARVYQSLAPDERARSAIWGAGYGEAGAVDFFGRAYDLPRAISGHQNYYLWGPGQWSGDVAITINIAGEYLRPWFDDVQLAATVDCEYCMPDRMHVPIYICRGLKQPVSEFWPKVKCWTCDKPAFVR